MFRPYQKMLCSDNVVKENRVGRSEINFISNSSEYIANSSTEVGSGEE